MYAKIANGQIVAYPYSPEDFGAEYPTTSPPADFTQTAIPDGEIVRVVITACPDGCIETTPIYNASLSRWEQAWA